MRLRNFLIETGGFAATGSLRSAMFAHSTASYASGIKKSNPHVFSFGTLMEQGANTQVHLFSSGSKNLRSDGSVDYTGSLSAVCHNPPASEDTTVKIRASLLFIAETE
tara:strand:+ start:148 stop:471 length:324 start_codon:yes stop_codon:yes gene_type:complete